jgi:transposase
MRKIKEVLRLQALGLKQEQIGRSCGISQSTVSEYVTTAAAAGISWEQIADWDEVRLKRELFPSRGSKVRGPVQAAPDFAAVHEQLQRHKHVTLQLLWEEYRQAAPDGYRYSRFCELYRRWRDRQDVVMRQQHRAGEKLFVDFAGDMVPVYVDGPNGEPRQASIFVAVLGASSYTYAEATWSQGLEDWIAAHVRTFEFLGGLPEIVVPDNTRAAVNKSCRYDPDLNRTYQDLATHYGVAVIPARPAKPRDKAKVEAGVLLVERWILAALRHHRFHSLSELNEAIGELLVRLNDRPFRKREDSRRTLFESVDKGALRALPAERYEFGQWRTTRVNIDYHVEFDRHWYSVPYQLTGEAVELRVTAAIVEIFHRGARIASHARSSVRHEATTVAAHRPKSHQRHLEWTPSRLVEWAHTVGHSTAELFDKIMAAKPHPEMGFRSCLGILRLSNVYSSERVEAAARRAIKWNACSYQSVKSMLERGLDQAEEESPAPSSPPARHPNIRGPEYFDNSTSGPVQ